MNGRLFAALMVWVVMSISSFSFAGYSWIMNPNNGHRYCVTSFGNWTSCENQALVAGGDLVTINDQSEQDWVFRTFGNYNGVKRLIWIGLNDVVVEGRFVWVSGDSSSCRYWANGEPNNANNPSGEDYVAMYYPGHSSGGMWNDWPDISSDPINIPFCGVIERPAILGDINGDAKIDVGDLGILAAYYGTAQNTQWSMGDMNGDGKVDVGDLGILAANYGYNYNVTAVPEPLSLLLLALGGVIIRRRK